jgi:hypothetical protein
MLGYHCWPELLGFGGSRMGLKSQAELFNCPNCDAQYRLVRAEAGPESLNGRIECYHRGGPLKGREGRFTSTCFMDRMIVRASVRSAAVWTSTPFGVRVTTKWENSGLGGS